MSCPSNFSLFYHMNNIWRGVKIKNLVIMQFPSVTPSIRPTYLRHILILEHPEPVAYRQSDNVPYTHTHAML